MSLPICCVYIFTSPSGASYVGQTRNFEKRIYQHLNSARKKKSQLPFHKAIRKYGIKNFSLVKIECNTNELNMFEKLFIQVFKSIGRIYNCSSGGDVEFSRKAVRKLSNETKRKMSETRLRNFRNKRQAREILEFRLYKQLREEKIKRETKFWFRVI